MTLTTQFVTMLAMIGMGGFFGAALDTYNRFLKRRKRKNWIVFLNDVLFWFLQGLIIFYVLFIVNEGELRFYIFIALVCGFAAYQSLLKAMYLRFLEKVIAWIVSVWRFLVKLVIHLIYKPILALITFIISLALMLAKSLLSLVILLGKIIFWLLKLVLKPVRLIFLLFWKLSPEKIKKFVEKIYNKNAGLFTKIKKYVSNIFKRWNKHTK